MKIKKLVQLRPVALAALGVFLGRGAQADTTLDFALPVPAGQVNYNQVIQSFGDYAAVSSAGVTVAGFGTPNIGLNWSATGAGDSRWDYYNDSGIYDVWAAGQLNASVVGAVHTITFSPNSPSARAVIKSFNFHPYYDFSFGEVFTFDVSVLAGTSVVSGPTHITFHSDGTKNHPVNLNCTGAPGQTLKLRIARVASTLGVGENEGAQGDIAVDDIVFAQLPESLQTVGPQVVSVSPADGQAGVAPAKSYSASITNGATTLAAGSIQLKLDGNPVSPPPTISSAGGLTNINYSDPVFLPSGSTHTYSLNYADNLGSNYTSDVQFTVSTFVMLPATYAAPAGSGVRRGFTHRTVSASLQTQTPGVPQGTDPKILTNRVWRAKAQLAGTLTNHVPPFQILTNEAAVGPNADGSFNVDTVLNFSDEATSAGNFINDVPFPGLTPAPATTNQSFATESSLYLEMPVGYHRFGINSDDGFEVSVDPPYGVSGTNIVVGVLDDGRGAADTVFDFVVQSSGLYRFKVIFFEGWGDASCEFFSVNIGTGQKMLINTNNPSAVVSYRGTTPLITGIVKSGSNVVIDWAYGTPPFQVQFKTNLTDAAWSDLGAPTASTTANVPIQPATGFMRVFYVQP